MTICLLFFFGLLLVLLYGSMVGFSKKTNCNNDNTMTIVIA